MVETGENRAEKLSKLHARKDALEKLEKENKAFATVLEELEGKGLKQESQRGE